MSLFPRVLDLGCGAGLYAARFFEKGYTVTGIDISKNSISYAIEMAKKDGHPEAVVRSIKRNCLTLKNLDLMDIC